MTQSVAPSSITDQECQQAERRRKGIGRKVTRMVTNRGILGWHRECIGRRDKNPRTQEAKNQGKKGTEIMTKMPITLKTTSLPILMNEIKLDERMEGKMESKQNVRVFHKDFPDYAERMEIIGMFCKVWQDNPEKLKLELKPLGI